MCIFNAPADSERSHAKTVAILFCSEDDSNARQL
jgi:hypothetical protein